MTTNVKGRHTGRKCYILGSGPSLNRFDCDKLASDGLTICCNAAMMAAFSSCSGVRAGLSKSFAATSIAGFSTSTRAVFPPRSGCGLTASSSRSPVASVSRGSSRTSLTAGTCFRSMETASWPFSKSSSRLPCSKGGIKGMMSFSQYVIAKANRYEVRQ